MPALPTELESQLQSHFERTRLFFKKLSERAPEAVVLGGGYGRGEGGVAQDEDGTSCFFNDLDYFIFCKEPNEPKLLQAVHDWERLESERLGIDVEGKCLPRSDLNATPHSMMFFDLVSAHTVVLGPEDYLQDYKALANPKTISVVEATRLLWNRGSGLLFAKCDLENDGALSIVHRNQAKAKLALGDALLTLRGKYRPYVTERLEMLQAEEGMDPRIAELHAEGTAFKLRPTATPSKETMQSLQVELTRIWLDCFLEVESNRLAQSFADPMDYARYRGKLFPDSSSPRNLLLALRDRLKRGGGLRPVTDYPRGALQRALICLLMEPARLDAAGRCLGADCANLVEAVQHYEKWWAHYS